MKVKLMQLLEKDTIISVEEFVGKSLSRRCGLHC